MMQLIAWFAGNRVASNLLMLLVITAGLLVLPSIRQEPFPNVALDLISITVAYPGAAPDEVEEAICIRIEEAIHDVEGIRKIRSTATEGYGSVSAELERGSNRRRVLDEIKTRVDALDTLPLEARRPVIQELIDDHVWLAIAVYGDGCPASERPVMLPACRDGVEGVARLAERDRVVKPGQLAERVRG